MNRLIKYPFLVLVLGIGIILLGIVALDRLLVYDAKLATRNNTPLFWWGDSFAEVASPPKQKDLYDFKTIEIHDSRLDITVIFSGCKKHTWDLYVVVVNPTTFNLYVTHSQNGNYCEMSRGATISFDLSSVINASDIPNSTITFIDYHGNRHEVNED
ncbi:MAG: hypothetical protein Q7S76_02140 [bacterium]|nr:hypothetical protein [bacterium]